MASGGGDDRPYGGDGQDGIWGDLRAGPGDDLDGGKGADDCDGETGTGDGANRCQAVAGVP